MKKKNRVIVSSFFVLTCITSTIGCRKADKLNTPQGVTASQPLVVQSRSASSASRTPPIHAEGARLRTTEEVSVPLTAAPYLDSVQVATIFQDVLSQGESLWGRYFTDGQYAYAANIRKYIQTKYGVLCEKLFIYGNLTGISPRYGCCASWQYDVACVIRGKGGMVYVLDPRLFTRMVSQSIWISSHLNPTECVPQPRLSNQALVAGECFTPFDNIPSGYLVDGDYTYTNIMVGYYADSVGCSCLPK